MRIISRTCPPPRRLGILPGSFNPPTRAHLALAHAALARLDEVLFVLPAALPHKSFDGASFEQRAAMLRLATASEPRFSTALSERGLFVEIASEAREHYPDSQLVFLCGRDAAERIVGWDYGEPEAIERILKGFGLMVAPRQGVYVPPPRVAHAVESLVLADYDECSATRVREALARGGDWRSLIPDEIADMVAVVYGVE